MITSLSSNAYVNDILHQPDALKNTLLGFQDSDFEPIRKLAKSIAGGALRRIVLTGMGSSYHALRPIFLTLVEQSIQSVMIETSELIHFAPKLLSEDTLLVVVSQSGQSAEILQLLELTGARVPMIGITNTEQSSLAKLSRSVMLTRAGPEHSVSCKTYVTALTALAILGNLLTGREPADTVTSFEAGVDAMTSYLSDWEAHLQQALEEMGDVRYIIYAGRGSSLASAGTSGLITKEAAHFPAEGMSCAAFRHGPLEMISSEVFVLVYEGIGPSSKLNVNLASDIQKAGGRARLVSVNDRSGLFDLPPVPAVCLPVMEILPTQLLSVALAIKNNHIPGQFAFATKITTIE